MEENKIVDVFMNKIKGMRFVDADDFFRKKDSIREKYRELTKDFKEMYKWYFYHQLCLLRQKQFRLKDLMWLYLNDENVDLDLSLEYRIFCEKRNMMYSDFYNVKLTKL